MKHVLAGVVLAGLIASIESCAPANEAQASPELVAADLPRTGLSVAVERTPMHAMFGEYRRAAVLREGTRELVRLPMFDDTGGYSRTNLYRSGDSTFVLVDAEASFAVSPLRRQLQRDSTRRGDAPSRGEFLGAFDVDTSHTWRFIPASERREQAVEFRGGTG